MTKQRKSIRVFRSEGRSGDVCFETLTINGKRTFDTSIKLLAFNVCLIIKQMHNSGCQRVTIIFTPPYDIYYPKGHRPRRCFPMTEEEQADFWKLFLKEEGQTEFWKFLLGKKEQAEFWKFILGD